ncbi:Sugar kinase of the NBD/HSP70 family, may contain an N-terminal HTH domain [Streptomyces sp. cf386]|uniref:ROK family transcriptional regulator n=1 Tax=Streptomyces sp. cf386 TaxID=1761904 RepID=UPI00087E2B8C|nr:ROK family transcriptional regulator [Streptomyces sp. cf386]SDO64453.1 Sugar kinase of the NBD/HSP70 family, may contain an N-terminal HTH domain [Streptomyces sp. cf386]
MPASPSTARVINDRLALRLLQQEGPLTAGQLKQLTGLSRPTVADLVERLTDAGLIEVVGEAGEQRRGPNAKLYGIVAGRAQLAALDVRTEGVSVVVSDLVGAVLAEESVPIGGDTGTGPAVEQAVALVERVVKEAGADRLHTVGIGAPGLIDPASGELRDSTGLPAWHRRLVAALQERLPEARVNVENETNLAALAEQRDGAARDRDTFVLLWLGHGTGAAVVLDGALRRGASGGTGEIGFLPVPGTSGLPSAVDCEGGFHSLAGSAAIVELAQEYGLGVEGGAAHEPPAAGVVRGAVAWVAAGSGESLGDGDGRGGGGGDGARRAGRSGADASGGLGGQAEVADARVRSRVGRTDQGPAASGASSGLSGAGASVESSGLSGAAASAESPRLSGTAASAESSRAYTTAVPVSPHHDAASAALPHNAPASAARFLDALADRLAIGVASVVAVLDPGCVVLAGEVGQAGGEELAGRVEERIRRMSPLSTSVRPSSLGGAAVLRGALLTARDAAQDELFTPPDR